jgi:phosphoenolpyruvate---glycerone phosphotransferase subunit DhaL
VGRPGGHRRAALGGLSAMPAQVLDAAGVRAWAAAVAAVVDAERDRLTELDAAIGDGDHGVNLSRGFSAVTAALASSDADTPGGVAILVGRTLISSVGGASGPLYGTLFRAMGKSFGAHPTVDTEQLAAGLTAGLVGIGRLGSAVPGDKTMVDALTPALAAWEADVVDGGDLVSAARAAAAAAAQGAEATIPMEARRGRASYLGPRSAGHKDPGAASTVLVLAALRDVVAAAD